MCICKYKDGIDIGTFDESSIQRGHFGILVSTLLNRGVFLVLFDTEVVLVSTW